MNPLGHVTFACGVVLIGTQLRQRAGRSEAAQASQWRIGQSLDYRFVALGALLPDIVDRPLGRYILKDFFDDNGHVIGHTLLFALLLLVPGAVLAIKRSGARVLSLGLGDLTHLAVDPVTNAPQTLFWPLLGTDFPHVTLLGPPATLATEIIAGLILATSVVFIYKRGRLPALVRTGRM